MGLSWAEKTLMFHSILCVIIESNESFRQECENFSFCIFWVLELKSAAYEGKSVQKSSRHGVSNVVIYNVNITLFWIFVKWNDSVLLSNRHDLAFSFYPSTCKSENIMWWCIWYSLVIHANGQKKWALVKPNWLSTVPCLYPIFMMKSLQDLCFVKQHLWYGKRWSLSFLCDF